MQPVVFIDRFSVGIDELSARSQRNPVRVLRMLHRAGRFSVFEATANETIANTVQWLFDNGYFTTDNSSRFPWSKVVVTAKGKSLIGVE